MPTRERAPQRAPHPSVAHVAEERGESWQLRLADVVTAFAGSMAFVWIHVVLFAVWMFVLGPNALNDPFPFNFLTMVVSLEAIFLATFVMIGQNRQAEVSARKAAHDYQEQELELKKNTKITLQTHKNTELLHRICEHLKIPHDDIVGAPKVGAAKVRKR